MEKCVNKECPLKIRCRRYTLPDINKKGETKFKFEEIKNPDGSVRGYRCQFQKFI